MPGQYEVVQHSTFRYQDIFPITSLLNYNYIFWITIMYVLSKVWLGKLLARVNRVKNILILYLAHYTYTRKYPKVIKVNQQWKIGINSSVKCSGYIPYPVGTKDISVKTHLLTGFYRKSGNNGKNMKILLLLPPPPLAYNWLDLSRQ